jgi:glycosyltransferase involved in cell wall biosynthesis
LNDPLPRALLEAMYLAKPCVVSNLKSMKEVIFHGKTGYIANISETSFATTINQIANAPESLKKVSKNARAFIKANCSMRDMAIKISNHGNF